MKFLPAFLFLGLALLGPVQALSSAEAAAPATVPEPAAALLGSLGLLALLRRRRVR